MITYGQIVLAATTGLILGLFFYGGLYITISRGLSSKRPALWFVGSFLLRIFVVLAGLYFISDGQWQRIVACLVSFTITGYVFKAWKSPLPQTQSTTTKTLSPVGEAVTVSAAKADRDTRHAP